MMDIQLAEEVLVLIIAHHQVGLILVDHDVQLIHVQALLVLIQQMEMEVIEEVRQVVILPKQQDQALTVAVIVQPIRQIIALLVVHLMKEVTAQAVIRQVLVLVVVKAVAVQAVLQVEVLLVHQILAIVDNLEFLVKLGNH